MLKSYTVTPVTPTFYTLYISCVYIPIYSLTRYE